MHMILFHTFREAQSCDLNIPSLKVIMVCVCVYAHMYVYMCCVYKISNKVLINKAGIIHCADCICHLFSRELDSYFVLSGMPKV